MQLLFIPLILGILPAYIANSKGKNFFIWWLYGFCLFIIALPHSILLKSISKGLRKCPQCAELIKEEASICRFCGFGKTEIAPSYENNPFIEWKKENPNGTLNDFYSQVKHSVPKIENSVISIQREHKDISNFESKKLMLAGIITLIGIVGYFSPWFSIPLFNISISGNDLRQLSTVVSKFAKVNQNSLILKYSWAIPISYMLFFVGNLLKSYLITFLSGIISIGYFLGIVILINISSFEIINFISIGIYLLLINFLITFYYLFKF